LLRKKTQPNTIISLNELQFYVISSHRHHRHHHLIFIQSKSFVRDVSGGGWISGKLFSCSCTNISKQKSSSLRNCHSCHIRPWGDEWGKIIWRRMKPNFRYIYVKSERNSAWHQMRLLPWCMLFLLLPSLFLFFK
jgi:hypothetical protein